MTEIDSCGAYRAMVSNNSLFLSYLEKSSASREGIERARNVYPIGVVPIPSDLAAIAGIPLNEAEKIIKYVW